MMHKLDPLLAKENITLEENIQSQLDQIYLDMAKGAFIKSRANWLEEGERNTNIFLLLRKYILEENH